VKEICIVTKQILNALLILRQRKIIHRDIKSLNILYEGDTDKFEEMYFVLSDFGECKSVRNNTTNNMDTIHGTPSWTAPEVTNRLSYSYAADMWSFGMVIYEMMTLSLPYTNEPFVGNAISAGKVPELSTELQLRYALMLPLYESLTHYNPINRADVEGAIRLCDSIVNG
jgi:serine/threonine protein kinase